MPFEFPPLPAFSKVPQREPAKCAEQEGRLKEFFKEAVLWAGVMLSSLPLVKLHEAAGTWHEEAETVVASEGKAKELAPEIVDSGLVYASMEVPGAANGTTQLYLAGIDRRGTADPGDDYVFYGLLAKAEEKKAGASGITMTITSWDNRLEEKGVRPVVAMAPSAEMPLDYYTDTGEFAGQASLDSLEKKMLAYDAIAFSAGAAGNEAAAHLADEILIEADAFASAFPKAQLEPSFQRHVEEMRRASGQLASR